jgi:phage baseplate assembly protein W
MYGRIIILERHLPTRKQAQKEYGSRYYEMCDLITKVGVEVEVEVEVEMGVRYWE